jgi:hypothetical protein
VEVGEMGTMMAQKIIVKMENGGWVTVLLLIKVLPATQSSILQTQADVRNLLTGALLMILKLLFLVRFPTRIPPPSPPVIRMTIAKDTIQ